MSFKYTYKKVTVTNVLKSSRKEKHEIRVNMRFHSALPAGPSACQIKYILLL